MNANRSPSRDIHRATQPDTSWTIHYATIRATCDATYGPTYRATCDATHSAVEETVQTRIARLEGRLSAC